MLSDLPGYMAWNDKQYLATADDRAIVIVAFGILDFANIMLGRRMAPSLSISVELFREADRLGLQHIFDLASLVDCGSLPPASLHPLTLT